MKQLTAFMKKECLELFRTGKLMVLLILSCLFGIMNPAIAKLTPWLMETMSGQLAETGITVGHVEVTALTSWTQFFKNLPIELIILIVMLSGILTFEYQTGTFINIVTKGLERWKIIVAKGLILLFSWTVSYALNYGITYTYNAYFWNNNDYSCVPFSAFCFYLFGLWLISVILPASVWFCSGTSVMLTVGAAFVCSYIPGMFPQLKMFVPTSLIKSSELMAGTAAANDYHTALLVTCLLIVGNVTIAVVGFNHKNCL